MLPDKLTILEQINTAIQRNSCKSDSGVGENMSDSTLIDQLNAYTNRNFIPVAERNSKINNLEQRVEMLETQNDRLLYFIHFLYKNFPELVKDIITTACFKNITEATSQQQPAENQNWNNDAYPCLTRREIEILHLVVKGLGAKEIASQLFISESTVITHKKNLKEKFRAKNTAELISKAYNLVPQEEGG